jgi:hypothetical protein
MAVEPSVKGAAIGRLVEDAKKLMARNEADRERIEAQLRSETLALLEGEVETMRWYPIEQYTEMTELLWREEGDRRIEYLHQRGENLMNRLMEGGLYQQLDYVRSKGPSNRKNVTRENILRACRLIGSVTGAIRNFGRDSFEWDRDYPDRVLHHVWEATHFPEVMRLVGEGCETFLLRFIRPDAPTVNSQRLTPDHIVYTPDYSGVLEPRE